MPFDFLRDLLAKAGKNIDSSGQMVKDQVSLAQKQAEQPEYQPSDAEKANEQKYFDSVTGAVVGSVAPRGGMYPKITKNIPIMESISPVKGGPLAQELAARESSNMMQNLAQESAGSVFSPISQSDIIRAQQAQSKAADLADRYRAQFAAVKKKLR